MKLVLLVAGVVIAATGLWVAAAPGILQGVPRALMRARYPWGVAKIAWGSALVWASGASSIPLLPQAIGTIELVKGIALLVVPAGPLERCIGRSVAGPRALHRLAGLAVLVLGVLLVGYIKIIERK